MRPPCWPKAPCSWPRRRTPCAASTIESLAGDLRFFDGRSTETNGWFLVRSLIPAGATKGAVRWRITPNAVPGWRRPPVIGISQVGYHPEQDKRAVIELDPRTTSLGEATLLKVDPEKGPVPVLERPLVRWGRFLRYDYALFDFTAVREPGAYVVRYGDAQTSPFLISPEVYRRDVWQPTLETFLPVQMCHVRVIDRGRIWHGACHMDDALQAPPNLDLAFIEGYKQGPVTETPFAADQHIPGLDRGGWHDAADHDLAGGAQAWATMLLALSRETFGLDSDQTTVDPGAAERHPPRSRRKARHPPAGRPRRRKPPDRVSRRRTQLHRDLGPLPGTVRDPGRTRPLDRQPRLRSVPGDRRGQGRPLGAPRRPLRLHQSRHRHGIRRRRGAGRLEPGAPGLRRPPGQGVPGDGRQGLGIRTGPPARPSAQSLCSRARGFPGGPRRRGAPDHDARSALRRASQDPAPRHRGPGRRKSAGPRPGRCPASRTRSSRSAWV